MRIFKLKRFAKFARDERIADTSLVQAIQRAERGLIDADLGGGLIKLRIARQGQGRSGGYRVVVGYRVKNRAIFLYGFAKSERANIDDDELETWRAVAASLLAATEAQLELAIEDGAILEVSDDETHK